MFKVRWFVQSEWGETGKGTGEQGRQTKMQSFPMIWDSMMRDKGFVERNTSIHERIVSLSDCSITSLSSSPWWAQWFGKMVKSKMLKIINVASHFSLNFAHDAHQDKSLISTNRPRVHHISILWISIICEASWVNMKIISNFSLTWGWKTENHLMMKNRKSLSIQNASNSKCLKYVLLYGNMCRLSVGFDAAGATLVGSRTRSKMLDFPDFLILLIKLRTWIRRICAHLVTTWHRYSLMA